MNHSSAIGRREFLKVSSIAGLGLVVSLYLPGCSRTQPTPLNPEITPISKEPTIFTPNVFITLGTDGSVTLTCPRPEMGQGTRTALPMILAEELGVAWSSVRIAQADAGYAYGNQQAGGSTSVRIYYTPLRKAGALVRKMLIHAASVKWDTLPENCFADNGLVTNRETQETLPYKDLVETAMTLNPDDYLPVNLKEPTDFKLIGTSIPRVDGPNIVTGKALYGMDTRVPDMLFAVVARCPVFGGKLVSFDDSRARSIPGVVEVVEITSGMNGIYPNRSVAVLAHDTWSAINGRDALIINWDEGSKFNLNSAEIEQNLLDSIFSPAAEGELVAYYTLPFFSHSPMEPINCTVRAGESDCDIWVPTQAPQELLDFIVSTYDLPPANTHLHVPLVGGGFGRRLEFPNRNIRLPAFHLGEAYDLSIHAGVPVQVVWTRDDDMHFEYYHPMSVTRVSARLDDITSLTSSRLEAIDYGIPTGAWRAVTNVPEAFAHESFIDEFAVATNQDPAKLRQQVLDERAKAVLNLAIERANWGTELPPGHGQGIAIHSTWGESPCAQVAEVTVDERGLVRVLRVVCAIDCGVVINPDMVRAQMEGGILFGLTSTLKANITISNGRVNQSNFHDYPLLLINEIPEIEVHILDSTFEPTGIGEMANPPIAPAVANAIYNAIGKRVRRLPIRPTDLITT